jgi:hypothetical protein
MARRKSGGFMEGLVQGYQISRQMKSDNEADALKGDLKDAANLGIIEQASGDEALNNFKQNYVPQEGGPATADEYIAANPDTFNGLRGQKAAKLVDGTARSDIEIDGLRAGRMAGVYEKHGKTEDAMRLRRDARQAKREESEDAWNSKLRTRTEGDWKKSDEVTNIYANLDPTSKDSVASAYGNLIKAGRVQDAEFLKEQYKKGEDENLWETIGAVRGGASASKVKELFEKTGAMKFDGEPVITKLKGGDYAVKGTLANGETFNIGSLNAYQRKLLTPQQAMTMEQSDRHHSEKMAAEAAKAGLGKKSFMTVYDEKGNPQQVLVDTSSLKPGDVVPVPKGMTTGKPTDRTDDRMKQISTEYKQVTDELEYLQKNVRPSEYFSWGKNDPENQDHARIDTLRTKAQALNDQMTAVRMAQYLPKNTAANDEGKQEGLPKTPPKKVSAEITHEEIAAAEDARKVAGLMREKKLAEEREKRRQAIAALEAQAVQVNGLHAR